MPLKPPAGTPKPPRKTPIRKLNNPKNPFNIHPRGSTYASPKTQLKRVTYCFLHKIIVFDFFLLGLRSY